MFLIRWISRWPLGLLHASGAALGWLVWALSPTYRRRLRENADLAGVDARARRRAIAETGRMVAETPWLWLHAGDAELSARVRWHEDAEFEVFSAAVTGPGPVIVLTPHMGSFEVAGRAYALRFGAGKPETVLYRPARSRALRELQEAARHRPNMATAPANLAGVRQMLRALRRGEMVGLLPDQVPPEGQGVWAPFFGRPAYTMTLAARLSQQTGAAVFVLRCERLPGGRGWIVHASRPTRPLPTGGDEASQALAARIVNETMEREIAAAPGQYLWGYNRYKPPRAADEPERATAPASDKPA
ncbi:MAG TPA: lysophospholipid acyltransferase family protein [Burkholderiaceae bacterium]